MRRTLIIAAAGGLSLAGWTSSAQDLIGDIDTDGDGAYSLVELQTEHPNLTEEEFAQADADGSGGLDADEYAAAVEADIIKPPAD